MLKINVIDCKIKGKTEACVFISLIFGKSYFFGNLLLFENFNVIQIGINKMELQLNN